MSGGHFGYIQFKIGEISDEIICIINDNGIADRFGESNDYSKETLDKFKEASKVMKQASSMIQSIDWLLSGDDGEDSFHRRWTEAGCDRDKQTNKGENNEKK